MKILAIVKKTDDTKTKESAIDLWRVKRPMLELAKHTGWQIDFQESIVRNIEQYEDPDRFIKEHGEREVDHIGQYDLVFTSYFTSPHVYTLLWGAQKKHGTKVILDLDDDLYDVDPENPFWLAAGWQGAHFLRTMAEIADYLCTTNDDLATKLRQKSGVDAKVYVIPNYISDDYKEYDPDNADKIVIGYFGGASHYFDLHDSGLFPAVQKVMHEHKNVHFKCVGQPVDYYLPSKRKHDVPVAEGENWASERFPQLHYDISVAPLRDTVFNRHKSNIKWQESTRMGAAFIASNIGPYKALPDAVAWKVPNTSQAWYLALKTLVEDAQKRRKQVRAAREELKNWRLEDNWIKYKTMIEEVTK